MVCIIIFREKILVIVNLNFVFELYFFSLFLLYILLLSENIIYFICFDFFEERLIFLSILCKYIVIVFYFIFKLVIIL